MLGIFSLLVSLIETKETEKTKGDLKTKTSRDNFRVQFADRSQMMSKNPAVASSLNSDRYVIICPRENFNGCVDLMRNDTTDKNKWYYVQTLTTDELKAGKTYGAGISAPIVSDARYSVKCRDNSGKEEYSVAYCVNKDTNTLQPWNTTQEGQKHDEMSKDYKDTEKKRKDSRNAKNKSSAKDKKNSIGDMHASIYNTIVGIALLLMMM